MKKIIFGLFLLFVCGTSVVRSADINTGKIIFNSRCTSCHAIGRQVIGPALKNIDKIRSESWIITFVHSSQTVIQSGDTAAVKLFKEFNQTIMPDHPDISDDKIKDIIAYIKDESVKLASQPAAAKEMPDLRPPYPEGSDGILHHIIYLNIPGEHRPVSFQETGKWLMIFSVISALVFLFLILVYYQTLSELISNEIRKLKDRNK